jgi:radical SAM superfamily enzyme YgiQ (UPF0313 family)
MELPEKPDITLNIILLNPPYYCKVVREGRCQHEAAIWDSVYPPLSLATIASYLRDDHNIQIFDAIVEETDLSVLAEKICHFDTDLVIASVSTPTITEDLQSLEHIKRSSNAKIAIFGVHATYFAKTLIKEDYIDYVLLHDPEEPSVQIATGRKADLEGVVYKEDGHIIVRAPNPKRISQFKIPAWDLVDLKNYKIPIRDKSYVLVSTARGCPYDCSFCVVPYYYGKKIRYREIDEITAELKAISEFVDEVFFHTDLFTFRKGYVLELCDRIRKDKINIQWICNSRVDTFDEEMAEAMKAAGCWMVSFGVESGNQNILDLCGKRISLEQSKRAVQICRETGLISIGHFVLGFPGETHETLGQTTRFSREIDPDFAEFYIATPFPGSRLFETVRQDISLDWHNIRYDHDPYHYGFNLEKRRKQAYYRFYLRPKKIVRFVRLFGLKKIFAMGSSAVRFLRSFLRQPG